MSNKLPRASLTQRIQVLDYYRGPPQRTQKETLEKFQAEGQFAISQATLSSWILNEDATRAMFQDNPNLVNYKKSPVLKYPEVMKAVEKHIESSSGKGVLITDQLIRDCFEYYLGIYGYDLKKVQFSTGMLHAFKRRNQIQRGKKRPLSNATRPSEDAKTDSTPTVDSPADTQMANFDLQDPISHVIPMLLSPLPPLLPLSTDHDIFQSSSLGFNTRLIHSDDSHSNFFSLLGNNSADQTTLTVDPQAIVNSNESHPLPPMENFSYSRTTHPNSEKVEKILENITNGHVTLYNSGTSAIMGLLTYLNCRRIAINSNGYQGTHQVIKLLSKLTGVQKISLSDHDQLQARDIMIIESPMNPEGYCVDIEKYSLLAHSKGALLLVDSTLAPPPLQDPFVQGLDYIIHSATKYFSGHSDLLAGFIVSKTKKEKLDLMEERFSLGTNIANFDSFLLLRSLRTFKMRILQQCTNTFQLITFLVERLPRYPIIVKIHHSSLQLDAFVKRQLNGYYNPVFAIEVKSMEIAKSLMTRFKFVNPKSNMAGGGGETTVELANLNPSFVSVDLLESDSLRSFGIRGNIVRFSIGCEDYEDLAKDLDQALRID